MNDTNTFTQRKSSLSFGEGWGEVCYLGSFDKVTNSSGAVVDSYSFDAWGNRRSATDWTVAETGITHLFNRGFTGHEHLDEFGLINMNGRCYDPLLGRILSPDPELQDPSNIQNYNRYSYCLNNPLKYTDPSGYYIYGKTYQADPVYSIPHFSDLDLPGGCRYDIAEYLDERQNRVEMEQMELNSRFGLVGGLGAGGGNNGGSPGMDNKTWQDILGVLGLSSGYSNKPGSSADDADETTGNPLTGAPSNVISAYNDNKDDIDFICDLLGFRLAGYSIGGRFALGPLGYSHEMGYISDNTGDSHYFDSSGWLFGLDASVGINFYLMPTDFKVQNFDNRSAQLNIDLPEAGGFSLVTDIQHGAEMDYIATKYGGFVYSLGAGIGGSFGFSNTINNGQTPWQNSVYSNGLINWANWLNIW